MSSKFVEGLKYRCLSDVPNDSNKEWMNGFSSCIEKLGYLEQALTYIVFEILAVREFCNHSGSIEFTGKHGKDEVSERFQKDVPLAFARMTFNTAILTATKLYEITADPGPSKHLRPLMEVLSKDAVTALDKRIALLDIKQLKYLRNKVVAHIDQVPYQNIDLAVKKVCPDNDLLSFFDLLEPSKPDNIMTTHEAIHKITTALKAVPGYQSSLQ